MKYPGTVSRSSPYKHYCATARALDVVGDRWTLLIVRDLLSGPRRFTELQTLLARVTPRQLTLRLKAMGAAGLVERSEDPGRKRVSYSLTALGRTLAPVVHALTVWGAQNAMGPPLGFEVVHPEHLLHGAAVLLNGIGVAPPDPLRWCFRFQEAGDLTLLWTGGQRAGRWRVLPALEGCDLDIFVEPRVLAGMVFEPERGAELISQVRFEGDAAHVSGFVGVIGTLCSAVGQEGRRERLSPGEGAILRR